MKGYLAEARYNFADVAAFVYACDVQTLCDTSSWAEDEWNQATVTNNITQLLKALKEHSPNARVFFMLNKMDQIAFPDAEDDAAALEAPVWEAVRRAGYNLDAVSTMHMGDAVAPTADGTDGGGGSAGHQHSHHQVHGHRRASSSSAMTPQELQMIHSRIGSVGYDHRAFYVTPDQVFDRALAAAVSSLGGVGGGSAASATAPLHSSTGRENAAGAAGVGITDGGADGTTTAEAPAPTATTAPTSGADGGSSTAVTVPPTTSSDATTTVIAAGDATPQVQIFLTSIFNSTIIEAWSCVVQSLLSPHVGVLQAFARATVEANDDWLLEAAVIERTTFLCLALASQFDAPVTHEFSAGLKKAKLISHLVHAATVTHAGHSMSLHPFSENTMLLLVADGATPAEVVRWNAEAATVAFAKNLAAAESSSPLLRELRSIMGLSH
jgi:hypothetical protein